MSSEKLRRRIKNVRRFKMDIAFCEKYDMFPVGGCILCAVSGGKDSMYLLENLRALAPAYGFSVSCAHFDHRLRGEESLRDRRFVEDWCRAHAVPCYTGEGDVRACAAENGLSIEEAARRLRYAFLEKTAEETGAARIATAHTADDNAETLLLNFARGTGLRGLCGIPPVRGRFIRPMLTTTSAEVLRWLEEKHIPHVEDSTNETDSCARNLVRHRVLPALRELNAGFDENAVRCMENLRADEMLLSARTEEFLRKNRRGNVLSAAALAALPEVLAARAVQRMCRRGLSEKHIRAVLALAAGDRPHGCADLPGLRVTRDRDRLVFGPVKTGTIAEQTLRPGEKTVVPEAKLTAECVFIACCSEIHNSFNIFCFKSDSICGTIKIKSRTDGEKIRLSGRNCTKSLKKLFSEAGLNGPERGLVPVLYDDRGPVAVCGFGISERCAAQPGDDVLRVTLRPLDDDSCDTL